MDIREIDAKEVTVCNACGHTKLVHLDQDSSVVTPSCAVTNCPCRYPSYKKHLKIHGIKTDCYHTIIETSAEDIWKFEFDKNTSPKTFGYVIENGTITIITPEGGPRIRVGDIIKHYKVYGIVKSPHMPDAFLMLRAIPNYKRGESRTMKKAAMVPARKLSNIEYEVPPGMSGDHICHLLKDRAWRV